MRNSRSEAEIFRSSLSRPEEFEQIFRLHWVPVFRFFERRVGLSHAEDFASEVFRIAFERRASYLESASGSCRPWLYGIASNLVLKQRRQYVRHLAAVERFASLSRAESDGPESEIAAQIDALSSWMVLREALVALDAISVQMLLLVAWEDATYSEVAEAFSVPVGTVRSRLHRLRAQLKSMLDASSATGDEAATHEDLR